MVLKKEKTYRVKGRRVFHDLIIYLLSTVVVASLMTVCMIYWYLNHISNINLARTAETYLEQLKKNLEDAVWVFNTKTISHICDSYMNTKLVSRLKIIDTFDNKVLYERQTPGIKRMLKVEGDVWHDNDVIAHIELGLSKRMAENETFRTLQAIAALIIVIILVIVGVSMISIRNLLHAPLQVLLDGIEKIASGMYDYHFKTLRHVEFRSITEKFEKMARQINDRETSLRESEERFRSLVETSSDFIWEINNKGVYTYSSPKIRDILGYEPSEIIGKTPFEIMPGDEAKRVERIFKSMASSIKPIEILENTNIHKDGQTVVLETSGVPILSHNGELLGYRGIDRDITDRKRAESELKRLQNLLSNIVNSMPSVLVGVDLDGKVIQWNHEAEKITGVPLKKADGCLLNHVLPLMADEMKHVFDAITAGEIKRNVKVTQKSNNDVRFSDVTIYPLISNGVKGAVIRIDDVTDKVRMEEMMIQSEKMLSVGGLAAGMAHEINNPLGGMMQTANVMTNRLTNIEMAANLRAAKEIGIRLDDVKRFMEKRGILRMLTTINDSGRRVAEIVDNMLSFARKSDAAVSTHDPADLLDIILELASTDYDLKKHYDFKTIEIIKEYEDNLPMVACEGAKIQQVLLNILRNGAQAMQEAMPKNSENNPRFILRLSHETETDMLHIEIEDNGPGMDEETRKRIFEPFFTTKPVGIGTGLGLSVSYFIIIENHGGEISVESTPGTGAKFIIRLPLEWRKT